MSINCSHPTCFDSPVCRRPAKQKKVYALKRKPVYKKRLPKCDVNSLTHAELLIVAQNAINARVRERDKNKTCICGCGRPIEQAGHLYPAGSYSGVRFDLDTNIHGIAKACNYYKATPAIDPMVEVGVVARIGLQATLALTKKAIETRAYKWSRQELISIINKTDCNE